MHTNLVDEILEAVSLRGRLVVPHVRVVREEGEERKCRYVGVRGRLSSRLQHQHLPAIHLRQSRGHHSSGCTPSHWHTQTHTHTGKENINSIYYLGTFIIYVIIWQRNITLLIVYIFSFACVSIVTYPLQSHIGAVCEVGAGRRKVVVNSVPRGTRADAASVWQSVLPDPQNRRAEQSAAGTSFGLNLTIKIV